jgi:hypothetical protein
MKTLLRVLVLGSVLLAAGCIVVPVDGGPGYYHHCGYYHCH